MKFDLKNIHLDRSGEKTVFKFLPLQIIDEKSTLVRLDMSLSDGSVKPIMNIVIENDRKNWHDINFLFAEYGDIGEVQQIRMVDTKIKASLALPRTPESNIEDTKSDLDGRGPPAISNEVTLKDSPEEKYFGIRSHYRFNIEALTDEDLEDHLEGISLLTESDEEGLVDNILSKGSG